MIFILHDKRRNELRVLNDLLLMFNFMTHKIVSGKRIWNRGIMCERIKHTTIIPREEVRPVFSLDRYSIGY